MRAGNYSFEDLVRIDCNLPPKDFFLSAIHEVAHFTLTKQTTFGLLCFFLSQDTDHGGTNLSQTLHLLERASEGVQESYARTMELLWGYDFPSLSPEKRNQVLENQRDQPYYLRFQMDILEPLLIHYERESTSPVFPHDLFFTAANIDIIPLLQAGLSDSRKILMILQQNPKRFHPDYRFRLLLQTYLRLRQKLPALQIHPQLLAAECGLEYNANIYANLPQLLSQMAASHEFLPQTRMVMMENAKKLIHYKLTPFKKREIDDTIRLSLYDYVIPYALEDRFQHLKSVQPVFRDHKNVLTIYLQPDKSFGADSPAMSKFKAAHEVHYSSLWIQKLVQDILLPMYQIWANIFFLYKTIPEQFGYIWMITKYFATCIYLTLKKSFFAVIQHGTN